MDMIHLAAVVDHRQAVAEVSAVPVEAHQPTGLHLVEYPQLGDPAAAAGDFQGPVGSGQDRYLKTPNKSKSTKTTLNNPVNIQGTTKIIAKILSNLVVCA